MLIEFCLISGRSTGVVPLARDLGRLTLRSVLRGNMGLKR